MASSRRKRLRRERQAGDGEARVEGVWRALAGGRACCSANVQRLGPVATRGSARTCVLATWPFCTRLRRERRATCATEVGAARRTEDGSRVLEGPAVVGVKTRPMV